MSPSRERDTYGTRRSPRRGRLLRIFDAVVLLLTVIGAVALLFAYLGQWIDPNRAWLFAFAGLAAPILYIANLILALYWIVRWRVFAFFPIVALVLGIGWLPLYFKPAPTRHNGDDIAGTVRVMTYNVAGFLDRGGVGRGSTLDSIASFIRETRPDILCMQEFQCRSSGEKPHMDSLIGLAANRVTYKLPNSQGGGWGTAIYTRYKIAAWESVDFGQTTNSAMWADLVIGHDTVRVFSCHLQTTSINSSDVEYIVRQEYLENEPDREDRVRSIMSKLRRNFRIRAVQAGLVDSLVRLSPYPVIVCGDFNDTPMSYAYRTIKGGMKDTFAEKGRGVPNTYKGLFNMFRIDYILHSEGVTTVSHHTHDIGFSDHKPVVAGLELAGRR